MSKKKYTVKLVGRADFAKTLDVYCDSVEDAIAAGSGAISQREFDDFQVDTIRFRIDATGDDDGSSTTK
jgi:hypothetical protein